MKNAILKILIALFPVFVTGQTPTSVWTQTANPGLLPVNGVAFTKDGNRIISGTDCHPARMRIYNTQNGNIDWDYTVGNSFMCIMGVGFSSNGNYFAGAEEMGNILVFDNTQQPPVLSNTIAMNTMYAFSIDFAPNNHKLAVGGASGKLQTYRLSNSSIDLNVNAHSSWVTAVNFSPDNTKIASGGSDAKVKIWDTTGILLQTLSSHTDDITSLKFSKDNTRLFSVSLDDKIEVWDVATGALLNTISPQAGDILGIDIAADNSRFVTVSADKQIRIYNMTTLALELSFGDTNSGTPRCVAWSPDDLSKIAVGYSNSTVILYDIGASTVGFQDKSDIRVNIVAYPNPFTREISIQWSQKLLKSLEVTDEQGKVIYTRENLESIDELKIPSELFKADGVYFLNSNTNTNERIVKKLVKQN